MIVDKVESKASKIDKPYGWISFNLNWG